MPILAEDLERKRGEVRRAHDTHGFHSIEYNRAFDELHQMNLTFMAEQYRAKRGLPPGAKTPYD